MIKLSKMSDHALVLCSVLAAAPGESLAAASWAKLSTLPEATTTKLLKKLCMAKICESKRGKEGGYRLARSAREVTFLHVVEAIDGPLRFSDCAIGDLGCRRSRGCGAKPHVIKIGGAIRSSLSSLTLIDIAQPGADHGQ